MKRLIVITIIAVLLTACGADPTTSPSVIQSVTPSPVIESHTVDFSCLSVDNDTTCTGVQDSPGVWNSGPIQTTGSPMPVDFINLEITNNSVINTSVFAYSFVDIIGCWTDEIAFDAVDLAPGESASFSYQIWNYRCGSLGYQESAVSLYNAVGFDPGAYINPLDYPRTELIANAIVLWENRIHSDMP